MSDVFKRYYILNKDEIVGEVDAVHEEDARGYALHHVGEHATVVEKP